MAISLNSTNEPYAAYGWVPVSELVTAVANGLLTLAEARTVIWSQLPVLQKQAATTPPAIDKGAGS